MWEARIKIESPELAEALNNLASAISSRKVPETGKSKTQSSSATSQPAPEPIQAPAPVQATVPTTQQAAPNVPLAQPPQYTVDQIMAAGATLMDAGKVNELINLLHSFGVQAVMDLKPEQLGPFATAMRELGAAI